MKRGSIPAFFLAVFCVLVPIYAFVLWTQRTLPPPASAHGGGIDAMINYTLVCTGLMLVAGHLVLAAFIVKFYKQQRATYGVASPKTEWKWALLPIVLMTVVAEGGVLVIGLPVWKQLYPTVVPGEAVVVEVAAQQFAWNFRYPGPDGKFGKTGLKYESASDQIGVDRTDPDGKDDYVQAAVLTVPANKLIRLRMRSKDVIHSLFLPNQRVKQDIVPGMVIDAYFTPTKAGKYEILCTELCGLGHYRMRGVLEVLEPAAFETWLKEEAVNE